MNGGEVTSTVYVLQFRNTPDRPWVVDAKFRDLPEARDAMEELRSYFKDYEYRLIERVERVVAE